MSQPGVPGFQAAPVAKTINDSTLRKSLRRSERTWIQLCLRFSGRWRRRRGWCDIAVNQVFQLLAGLEEGDLFGGNLDPVAGLGIAADAGLTLPSAEAAKAANFNLVTGAQRAHHALKDCFNNDFAVLAGQLRQAGHFIDQICLGHRGSPLCGRCNRHNWDTLRFSVMLASPNYCCTSVPQSRGDRLLPQVIKASVRLHELGRVGQVLRNVAE